jgi:hypothetical protein
VADLQILQQSTGVKKGKAGAGSTYKACPQNK